MHLQAAGRKVRDKTDRAGRIDRCEMRRADRDRAAVDRYPREPEQQPLV